MGIVVKMDELEGKTIIGYGLGTYYNIVKDSLPFKLDYISDKKYKEFGKCYNNIPVISQAEMLDIKNPFVIVFALNSYIYESISEDLKQMGLPFARAQKFIHRGVVIEGQELKEKYCNKYCDELGNSIICKGDYIGSNIKVIFQGENNRLIIGEGVKFGELLVRFGSNANCYIGERTEIIGAEIHITHGIVDIEKDCLIAANVWITNHDHHSIFDIETGKRINVAKNIQIGNHVWIGKGVTVLPGFKIGNNSIIGTQSVSSSKFGNNVIIAGNPAKVIREGVIWSSDNTEFYQHLNYEECDDRRGDQYEDEKY